MRPFGRLQDTDKELVSELIQPGTHQWDEHVVRSIFFAPDADRILQIPLRRTDGEDWLAWSHEKSGIYTVRSAYRALVSAKEQMDVQPATASALSEGEKWKKLWKLDVLPRVRVFWWRVLKGIVPVYATLARRHVKDQSTCPVCKATSETLMHALVECSHAQLFWTAAKDAFNLKLPRLNPVTWTEDILSEPTFEGLDKSLTISIMAAIWDSRNKWSHDDAGYNPKATVDSIAVTLAMLDGLKKKKKTAITRPHCTWHGPPLGVIKLNSDGAIRSDEGIASTGGVARDSNGFKSAWCKLYRGISDPLIIEALALRDAIVEARSQHFDRIVAETDSSELVRLWMERGNHRAVIAPIISEISDISKQFSSFEVLFVRRSANSVAHECARFACAHGVSQVWLNESPEFLFSSLTADCNSGDLNLI
jgi:ribonuclease HI